MAFRANESAETELQRVRHDFIPHDFSADERKAAEQGLAGIVRDHGPAVRAYPMWHPLVSNDPDRRVPFHITSPGPECGYDGLDHTALFAHAFVTCPYDGGERILRSFQDLPRRMRDRLSIDRIAFPFYSRQTTGIIVWWDHGETFEEGHLVPKRLAIPMMLEQMLPWAKWSEVAETWETMRPYLLGQPYGGRSSAFVSQNTGLAIKRMLEALNESGMFGPGYEG